ncbi:hypothetical protein MMPV_001061 [Pyropia vietnamensis]
MGATASLPAHEATDAPRRPPTYTLDGDVLRLETSSPSNDGSAAIETAAAAPASYELVWIPRRDLPVLRRREVVREAPGDVDYTRHRGNDAARAAATDPTTVRLPAVLVRGGGRRKGGIVLLLAHGDGEDLGDVAGQAARLAAALRVDVLAYELSGWGRAPVVGLAPAQGGEGAARARGADRDGIDGSTDEEDNGDDAETPLHPTRSRRLPSEATLAADARAAYVYATTRLGGRGSSAVRRVVAVGRGTGALAAVGLAATPGVRLAGLVLASPPPTAVAAATNAAAPPLWGGAGAPPGRRVAAPTAPPVCPVLVVHDEGDDAVPLDATALRLAVGLRGRACRPPALSTSGRGGAAAAAAAAAAAEAASAASAAATVSGAGGLAAPPVVAHLRRFLRSLRYRRMSAQPGTSFCTSTVAESAAAGVPSRTVVSVPSMISAAAAASSSDVDSGEGGFEDDDDLLLGGGGTIGGGEQGDVYESDMAEEQLTSASVAAVQDSLRAAYAARDDFFSPDHIDVSSSADDDDECASAAERTWRAPTAEALAASAAAAAAAAEPPKPGMPRVAASNSTAVGDATAVTTAATHEAVDVLWKQGDKSVDAKGCSRRHSAEVWRPDPADALGGDSASGGRPAPMPLRQAPWFGAPPNNPAEDDGSRPHRLHRLGGPGRYLIYFAGAP